MYKKTLTLPTGSVSVSVKTVYSRWTVVRVCWDFNTNYDILVCPEVNKEAKIKTFFKYYYFVITNTDNMQYLIDTLLPFFRLILLNYPLMVPFSGKGKEENISS